MIVTRCNEFGGPRKELNLVCKICCVSGSSYSVMFVQKQYVIKARRLIPVLIAGVFIWNRRR
jgi:hypothetical protein